jgi:hypothetical protein
MAQEYSLQNFIRDLDDITRNQNSPGAIVAAAKPLLAKLVQRPDCVEPKFKKRGVTEYGRYANFLDALVAALTDAMGPMSGIVLRDQIKSLGESSKRFPHAKVEMLVESVSGEILDEGMRAQFRHQMLEQIRTLQSS